MKEYIVKVQENNGNIAYVSVEARDKRMARINTVLLGYEVLQEPQTTKEYYK